jgi:hypothetical protein
MITVIASVSVHGQERDPIVAVGCVNRAPQTGSVGGSPGVPPAPPSRADVLANSSEPLNVFMLNGATAPDATEDTRARAATGQSPAELPTAYVLDGNRQDIESHLGHRVEVTGLLTAPNEGGPAATKSTVRHIQVASIRMLSSTCPVSSTEPVK